MSSNKPDEAKQYATVLKFGILVYVMSLAVYFVIGPEGFLRGKLAFMIYLMTAALVFALAKYIQLRRFKNGRK
jgi:hypothetical protein